jgi:O-antigen/teichoic acid export membrane protein
MSSISPSLIERSREFLSLNAGRTRTLRTNFVWNAVGSGVFAMSQWGILIIFAKLGSATLVGQLVYGLALAAPLFVVAGLQLRSIQATDPESRHSVGQYLGLRAVTTLAALLVASAIAAVMWVIGSQLALIVLFWALSKAVDAGSDALYGLFQQSERMDYVGISLTLRGILAVASVAVLFRASRSAPLALAGLVITWVAAFILFDVPMARNLLSHRKPSAFNAGRVAETLRLVLDRRQLMPLCLEAAPLGIVAFLLTIQAQVPRYVVVGLLHTRALGLFAAAAYLTFVGAILVNSLGAPACVRLAQYHVTGSRSGFRRLMTKLILVAAVLGVAGILIAAFAGGRILTLLYTHEYSGMAGVLTILCAASALSFIASFLGYGMTALRRFNIQVPIFVAVALITLISCYFLTRSYGLMGAAVGILIGNLAQLIMSAAVVWRTSQQDSKMTASGSREAIGTAESLL